MRGREGVLRGGERGCGFGGRERRSGGGGSIGFMFGWDCGLCADVGVCGTGESVGLFVGVGERVLCGVGYGLFYFSGDDVDRVALVGEEGVEEGGDGT